MQEFSLHRHSHIWLTIFKWIQMGQAARCNNLPPSFSFWFLYLPRRLFNLFPLFFLSLSILSFSLLHTVLLPADGNIQILGHTVLVRTSQTFSSQKICSAKHWFERKNGCTAANVRKPASKHIKQVGTVEKTWTVYLQCCPSDSDLNESLEANSGEIKS